ncbi:hypothetical protein LV779_33955 [Streptomyces thinghirensis]|nr:hypothetical protein [Streptomyces thinghirensis]
MTAPDATGLPWSTRAPREVLKRWLDGAPTLHHRPVPVPATRPWPTAERAREP